MSIDYLKEMGIQEWRLRAPSVSETELVISAKSSKEQSVGNDEGIEKSSATQANGVQTKGLSLSTRSWQELADLVGDSEFCPPCANGSVFGQGARRANLTFVFDEPESPSTNEVVSGRARLLLDNILMALNMDNDQVFITSVQKCQSKDKQIENVNCIPVFERQLQLLDSAGIICFGERCAQRVMKSNAQLTALRTVKHFYTRGDLNGNNEVKIPMVATWSLRDMLDSPERKADVWNDIKHLRD